MAVVPSHTRSNSLPAASHPLVADIEQQVCRLRQSQSASTSSFSISHNLSGLRDLYDCVDTILQLPLTRQALIQDQNCFDQLLDGSLALLDLCNTANDALLQMKDSVAELHSVVRRRQCGLLECETRRYMNSRKSVKKTIQKVLKGIKSRKSTSSGDKIETNTMLREAESVVLMVLESLLSFISQPRKSWPLVSKLVTLQKRVESEDEATANEFAELDASLKTNKSNEGVQLHLKNLQMCLEDLEGGVECLFRRLIKTRASILNIYNL